MPKHFLSASRREPWLPHHCQPTLYARYSPYLKYLPINHRHKLSHLMDAGNPQCTYRWCQNSKHSLASLISILGTALLDIDLPFSQCFSLTACKDLYSIQPNDHLRMCRSFTCPFSCAVSFFFTGKIIVLLHASFCSVNILQMNKTTRERDVKIARPSGWICDVLRVGSNALDCTCSTFCVRHQSC